MIGSAAGDTEEPYQHALPGARCRRGPTLVLGPMLRHVSMRSATVWVETSGACEVEVLGHSARTFCVRGHHYALVAVEGLSPDTTYPYEVRLDGETTWPPADSSFPASVVRTLGGSGEPVRVVFGSCRFAAPHEPPWSLELDHDENGRGVDALRAYALRMMRDPPSTWPHIAVMLGDQVYADCPSPLTKQRIVDARGHLTSTPIDIVADFEEYCWLYHESWQPEVERWFFSVVPTAMIFDDHDMVDDWNISESWAKEIDTKPWWRDHVLAGLSTYWVYQHLGNLSPLDIEREGLLQQLQEVPDGSEILYEWAERSEAATPLPGGYRFSYARELGDVRLVVIDARNGRVLDRGQRLMIDRDEFAFVAEEAAAPVEHVILATSLPVLVPGALHDLQVWNEAICDGAWGRWAARAGERVRRSLDLEDWPAFSQSFDDLLGLLEQVGGADSAPRSMTLLSGDIHFSYVAELEFPDGDPVRSALHQVVSSPIRNALVCRERNVMRMAASRVAGVVARVLRRATGRRPSRGVWKMTEGPVFANSIGLARFEDGRATVVIERAIPDDDGQPMLDVVIERELCPPRSMDGDLGRGLDEKEAAS